MSVTADNDVVVQRDVELDSPPSGEPRQSVIPSRLNDGHWGVDEHDGGGELDDRRAEDHAIVDPCAAVVAIEP